MVRTCVVKPTVTRGSPSSGPVAGGAAVTITGTNFAFGRDGDVWPCGSDERDGGEQHQHHRDNSGREGRGVVTVTVTNGQTGSLSSGFTYVVPPTVSSVSPNNGPTTGGTAVTITGTNFAAGATVTFGSAAATNVVVVSSTSITATTPAGSAGAVTLTVTVSGQSGSLANAFTWRVKPTVTSVSPSSGPLRRGTPLRSKDQSASGATVTFGSASATNDVEVSSTSTTATTPAGRQ